MASPTERVEGLVHKLLSFAYYLVGAYLGLLTALLSCYVVLLHDSYKLVWDVLKHPTTYVPWPQEPIRRLPKNNINAPAMTSVSTTAVRTSNGTPAITSRPVTTTVRS